MKITTEVTNSNKDKVKIHVEPNCNYSSRNIKYGISLEITPYRKRKSFFLDYIIRGNNYGCRFLHTKEERENYAKEEVLKYITIEQLQMAVNNAYDALKPTAENIKFC